MTDRITLLESDDQGALICPVCRASEWTHVDGVDIIAANGAGLSVRTGGEDAGASITASPFTHTGYFGRRHSIVLRYSCEQCDVEEGKITFEQHKGQTMTEISAS